jgi:hypothetical protein
MTPRRIQRRRTKGWKMPEGAVYVGRPTRWGNPWKLGDNMHDPAVPGGWRTCATAADCVAAFRRSVDWDPPTAEKPWSIEGGTAEEPTVLDAWGGHSDGTHVMRRSIRKYLRGKDLACWCPLDQPCHADVLLELANK